ncbi:MAG: hypothetical protein JSV09_04230 [Thermoplasmata archaeon]|nr:MAG: hypothetical protein JSV09_04230 [Thermoplasmata archaeon]
MTVPKRKLKRRGGDSGTQLFHKNLDQIKGILSNTLITHDRPIESAEGEI